MDDLYKLFGGGEQLWDTICQYAEKTGRETTRLILDLYYVLKSPDTPLVDKTLIIAALGYQLLPEDVMSKDKYGLLGMLDNGAALIWAYNKVKSRVTPQIETQVDTILNQWFGQPQEQSTAEGFQKENGFLSETSSSYPDNRLSSGLEDDEDVVID